MNVFVFSAVDCEAFTGLYQAGELGIEYVLQRLYLSHQALELLLLALRDP
jgi:hypothetical protein